MDGFSGNQSIAEGVGQHLQHLVAHGELPAISELDQGQGLIVFVEVNPRDPRPAYIVADDNWPVADGHICEGSERIQGGVQVPDGREIPGNLLLNGSTGLGELRKGDFWRFGN